MVLYAPHGSPEKEIEIPLLYRDINNLVKLKYGIKIKKRKKSKHKKTK